MTPSSVLYAFKSGPSSAKHSSHAPDPQPGRSKGGLEAQVRSQYLQGLSKKPQATWLRRFGAITKTEPPAQLKRRQLSPPYSRDVLRVHQR
jgi:hypothetical protein